MTWWDEATVMTEEEWTKVAERINDSVRRPNPLTQLIAGGTIKFAKVSKLPSIYGSQTAPPEGKRGDHETQGRHLPGDHLD